MIKAVKDAFALHAKDVEKLPEKKRPRTTATYMNKPATRADDPNDLYLKQFVYPSQQLGQTRRIAIFNAIKFYLIGARPDIIDRIKQKMCKKYTPPASIQERRIAHKQRKHK
eukprot:55538_1